MSNNYINSVITHKFDFSDEELLAQYISLLKTIALKFDKNVIQFFFNKETKKFPLFEESMRFFNYNDMMIRSAIRVITLKVYGVRDEGLNDYIIKTSEEYFPLLTKYVFAQFLHLNELIYVKKSPVGQDLILDNIDHLYYLNDIMNLNIPELSTILIRSLRDNIFVRLCQALEKKDGVQEIEDEIKSLKMEEDVSIATPKSNTPLNKESYGLNTPKIEMQVVKTESPVLPDVEIKEIVEIEQEVQYTEPDFELHLPFSMYLISQIFLAFTKSELIEELSSIVLKGYKTKIYQLISSGMDPLTYCAICVIYSIIQNPSTPDAILKEYGLLPLSRGGKPEEYPHDLFDSLLLCLKIQKVKRIKTYHTIHKLFAEFYGPNCLNEIHLGKFKEITLETAQLVYSYFKDTLGNVKDISLLLEQEYQTYRFLVYLRNDQLISDHLMILSGLSSDIELYKRDPKHRNEMIKIDCHKYLVLYYIWSIINTKTTQDVDKFNDDLLQKPIKYPPGNEIQVDNKEMIKCNVYVQQNGNTISLPRIIIIEAGYFYIVEGNVTKLSMGKVKAAVPLLNLKTQTNPDHKYQLRVFAERLSKTGIGIRKIFECVLIFENTKTCAIAKGIIDTRIDETIILRETEITNFLTIQ